MHYEPAQGDGSIPIPIADNDAIAAVLAVQLKCDLLLLLSNVPGVRVRDGGCVGIGVSVWMFGECLPTLQLG